MRIYRVVTELPGSANWNSHKVAATTFAQAVSKVSLDKNLKERISEVILLESTD